MSDEHPGHPGQDHCDGCYEEEYGGLVALPDLILEYDDKNHALIATERLSATEYGAAAIAGHGVPPYIGVEIARRYNAEPIDRGRLALALHSAYDDCAFMFGRECDCLWARRLNEAFARYDNPNFPSHRDGDGW